MNKFEVFSIIASQVLYCKNHGTLTWKKREGDDPLTRTWNTKYAGKECGGLDRTTGYRKIAMTINGASRFVYSHRLAWFMEHGEIPSGQIDHIDHNKTNNRISNLRDVSRSQNQRNKLMPKNNTSGVTGVAWHKQRGKWVAYSRVSGSGKIKHLGLYESISEAEAAVIKFRKEHGYSEMHGEKPD